ncbi:Hemolysin activation/secretion protein [Hahella chejuensis KCTC 2396]|uniref:Hemolysin activation/secretion protein n=1 Tax=Hahella chejuensis (strain KCTC 2396) TaxID=349521 RepID=Q2SGU5_HAHCH|nr:ShlB/FhaC/HecB family hemolysin secretion/activation protein [Hahella chejuensis]ABC30129.1 Hemolysin activation/secretion protein [Hahella chejuensis KCTC 2396]
MPKLRLILNQLARPGAIGPACLLLSVLAAESPKAEENTRGVKLTSPVKPLFNEPMLSEPGAPPQVLQQVLPPLKKSEREAELKSQVRFLLNALVLEGSTVLSRADTDPVFAPYLQRWITMEQLQEIRQTLSIMYLQRGYVNSGVVIPDQRVSNGVVRLIAVEGRLASVNLTGNDDIADAYLLQRILPATNQPLNAGELQKALRQLQKDRLIAQIHAQLKPGGGLGEADLDIQVREAASKRISLTLDNRRTPSVGAEQATLNFSDDNLTGYGDSLSLTLNGSAGVASGGVDYAFFVSRFDSRILLSYDISDSRVVEEPFDQLDIESVSSSYSLGFSQPFYLSDNATLTANLSLAHKQSETFLLGEPFSFSEGAVEGQTSTTTLQLGLDWMLRTRDQAIYASLSARRGLDVLGATDTEDGGGEGPNGVFFALLGQLQYATRMDVWKGGRFILRASGQKAFAPLFSMEKYSVGGRDSVRGYRENQLVRDNGLSLSAELRLPVLTGESGADRYKLRLIPFIDSGLSWDESSSAHASEKVDIYSVGLGLQGDPLPGLHVDLFWAQALQKDNVRTDGDDLQDKGLHFSVQYLHEF